MLSEDKPNIKLSLTLSILVQDALARLVVVPFLADFANAVLPGLTVLHIAPAVHKFILTRTLLAVYSVFIETALDFALVSLEFVVGVAVGALTSLIPNTAELNGLAQSFQSEVKPAVAGHASVIVVAFAVANFTVPLIQDERLHALLADMINLVLAP